MCKLQEDIDVKMDYLFIFCGSCGSRSCFEINLQTPCTLSNSLLSSARVSWLVCLWVPSGRAAWNFWLAMFFKHHAATKAWQEDRSSLQYIVTNKLVQRCLSLHTRCVGLRGMEQPMKNSPCPICAQEQPSVQQFGLSKGEQIVVVIMCHDVRCKSLGRSSRNLQVYLIRRINRFLVFLLCSHQSWMFWGCSLFVFLIDKIFHNVVHKIILTDDKMLNNLHKINYFNWLLKKTNQWVQSLVSEAFVIWRWGNTLMEGSVGPPPEHF